MSTDELLEALNPANRTLGSVIGMEIQFGDFKITVPYEKYMLKHSMENPFGTMFLKSNKDFFNAFFKKAPTDYMHYFEEYKKRMDKLAKMSKSGQSEE